MQIHFIGLFDIIHAAKECPELVTEIPYFRTEGPRKFFLQDDRVRRSVFVLFHLYSIDAIILKF